MVIGLTNIHLEGVLDDFLGDFNRESIIRTVSTA